MRSSLVVACRPHDEAIGCRDTTNRFSAPKMVYWIATKHHHPQAPAYIDIGQEVNCRLDIMDRYQWNPAPSPLPSMQSPFAPVHVYAAADPAILQPGSQCY